MTRDNDNYWTRWSTRRHFLGAAAASGAGLAGLALAGCGDDDDKPSGGGTTPAAGGSPAGSPATSGDQPRPGGTLRLPLRGLSSADPPTLDPFESLTFLAQMPATLHYSRLLKSQTGPNIAAEDFTRIEGDLASGWEQPNETTYLFTFKPNIKFHDKAPMNGRVATATDFARTYEAFLKSQNSAAWKTVVDKVEAPSATTLRVTLKEPFAPFLVTHASSAEGCWFIPIELIESGQVKKDPVGTGPWVFRQWETGVALRYDKHRGFHDAPLPYVDKIEASLSNDPQRIIAGLAAGTLDSSLLSSAVYNEVKSKVDPRGTGHLAASPELTGFIFNFDIKPWNDKRVRQALSLALDRDAYLKLQDQTGKGDWFSHIAASLAPYFISPRNESAFGPNAKWFKKNIAEAKALLSAAGYPDGLAFKLHANVDAYGPIYQQEWEIIASTIKEAGFRAEPNYQPYGQWLQSSYLGKFSEGVAVSPLIGSPRDPDNIFYTNYASVAARHNWSGTPISEQADLDARFARQRRALKLEDRVNEVKEIQKVMAESMLVVPTYGISQYLYAQPWLKNFFNKIGYGTFPESYAKAYFTEDRIKRG